MSEWTSKDRPVLSDDYWPELKEILGLPDLTRSIVVHFPLDEAVHADVVFMLTGDQTKRLVSFMRKYAWVRKSEKKDEETGA